MHSSEKPKAIPEKKYLLRRKSNTDSKLNIMAGASRIAIELRLNEVISHANSMDEHKARTLFFKTMSAILP
ncbi:MAG: hypothetical protein QXF08_00830, partial [Nitrososphaerota archaeon]